ncbi:hypothetical protein K438DRAFT_1998827 [Mycena galopus ATCC 62051]|nr:hypothetical protein K438DRAFT_1998827 [Mycena galopus ATCC 62051]
MLLLGSSVFLALGVVRATTFNVVVSTPGHTVPSNLYGMMFEFTRMYQSLPRTGINVVSGTTYTGFFYYRVSTTPATTIFSTFTASFRNAGATFGSSTVAFTSSEG